MKVGDEFIIGKYKATICKNYCEEYFLNGSGRDNSDLFKQYTLSNTEFQLNVGIEMDFKGGFPYHKSLEDLKKSIVYLQSLEGKTELRIGYKEHPDYVNLTGRSVIWKNNGMQPFGTIDKIVCDTDENTIILRDYGKLNRFRFLNKQIELVPIEPKYEEWDNKNPNYKSLVGRKIKWIQPLKGSNVTHIIDTIIEETETIDHCLTLEHYKSLSRSRFRDKEVELLPEDYIENTIISNSEKSFKVGDKIYGKSKYNREIANFNSSHGELHKFCIIDKIISLCKDEITFSTGTDFFVCKIDQIFHYDDNTVSVNHHSLDNPSQDTTIPIELSYSLKTINYDNGSSLPQPLVIKKLSDIPFYGNLDILDEESHNTRIKPSLLEPLKIKKRVLI